VTASIIQQWVQLARQSLESSSFEEPRSSWVEEELAWAVLCLARELNSVTGVPSHEQDSTRTHHSP
jgi:hypothetical protein